MASATVVDLSQRFNSAPTSCIVNVGGCDSVVVHIETASAAINFNCSLDGGTSGNAVTAAAFQPIQATNVATGLGATSAASGNGVYRFSTIGSYLQFAAAGGTTVTKLLVYLSRIN